MSTDPVMFPNWPAALLAAVLVALIILVVWGFYEWWRTRRDVRQIEGHRLMGIGMKEAHRRGWLPDDTQ